MHDLAVVGLGLIGSAVARHAAARGADVVAIGPPEPDDWASHDGPFASHYDSGRITRRLDARWEWAELATRAIDQYPTITAESGIEFHHPVGLVFVRNDTEGIGHLREVAARLDIPFDEATVAADGTGVAHHRFPPGWTVLTEGAPAGFIDPRRMIDAQLAAAARRGAVIHRDTVASVTAADGHHRLGLGAGSVVSAERVVVATGAYGNDVLAGLADPLATAVRAEAVVLAEVHPDEARRIVTAPSAIHLLDDPELENVYTVPPTRFPDGRYHVKLGGTQVGNRPLTDPAARHRWMAGDDAERLLPAMRRVLTAMMPNVEFRSWTMKPCLLTDTVSGLPYIDHVVDGVVAAVGGNGHAGKSADAVGALAAALVLDGRWTDRVLPAETFRAETGVFHPVGETRHGPHRR